MYNDNPTLASLDKKIDDIKNNIKETDKLKSDAKELLDNVQNEINNLEQKKTDILQNAQESTKRLVESKTKEIELLLKRQEKSASLAIETQKNKATKEMGEEFQLKTVDLVKKYLQSTKNNNMSDIEIMKSLDSKK